ncbi:ankyrin repeat domain-containing protein [Streptomyces prunicolor]|uniref:Ankyrin repeat domain-containing protein n=1 Tax=Streptomyces prunicolor TaxID=67348 RepID=A0ABU4FV34_9ACTN|nr:ankyrin repeat domain-containing protein [Streptomyces prunicolor]MCX5234161.1 ankyrin repeat domain-containing protein [Streptomyces prunicolor]MDV7223868.1 ankyrin repeat domain-containing protein [Streptomyces prunicolor]
MIRNRMEWDALTDREPNAWYREERDRLSDLARDANWSGLFEELRKHPSRVNLPRIGIRTGYAPLHQAAWHGADFPVVSRLIAHGAWRTQRTRDGQRAVDVARKQGHTHLLELLEPVVVRPLPSPPEMLEHRFHSLLRERTGSCFEETEHLLPPLAPLTEAPAMDITFTVFGMMGGVTYRLEDDHLYVHFHSRMDADDGEHYHVTPESWSKIKSPRMPPPPPPAPQRPTP